MMGATVITKITIRPTRKGTAMIRLKMTEMMGMMETIVIVETKDYRSGTGSPTMWVIKEMIRTRIPELSRTMMGMINLTTRTMDSGESSRTPIKRAMMHRIKSSLETQEDGRVAWRPRHARYCYIILYHTTMHWNSQEQSSACTCHCPYRKRFK